MKRAAWRTCLTISAIGISGILAADGFGATPPQPRPRLQRDASGAVAVTEQKPTDGSEPTTTLEKVNVTESKLRTPPKPLEEYRGDKFSFSKGGPLYRKSGKRISVLAGFWNHPNVFAEDARFSGQQTHAQFDLLRIKW